jgi:hypothetical protein
MTTESDPRALRAAAGLASPLAVPIREAAQHVGLSRGQFYREFLTPGRVKAIATGKRDRIVLVAELEAAFVKYIAEKRGTAAEQTAA